MKYYIVKAKSASTREDIIQGILHMDSSAEIVKDIEDCDIVILQQGWTRSKNAVAEKNYASLELRKSCHEGYLYTDKYEAHIN